MAGGTTAGQRENSQGTTQTTTKPNPFGSLSSALGIGLSLLASRFLGRNFSYSHYPYYNGYVGYSWYRPTYYYYDHYPYYYYNYRG
ncbi:unnamed protein product [Cercopithifilaria johnstoni]|uniref:Uncharacterized protein n=1 Tax=Cercopithifilaria johnstoni TaxID=2874296 RepID=A0A8J2MUZ2_9BILA|nr:unnamed protein product [Cercopithifilaria johnstoni]